MNNKEDSPAGNHTQQDKENSLITTEVNTTPVDINMSVECGKADSIFNNVGLDNRFYEKLMVFMETHDRKPLDEFRETLSMKLQLVFDTAMDELKEGLGCVVDIITEISVIFDNIKRNRVFGSTQQVFSGFALYFKSLMRLKRMNTPACVGCEAKLSNGYKVDDPDNLPLMSCCSGCGGE